MRVMVRMPDRQSDYLANAALLRTRFGLSIDQAIDITRGRRYAIFVRSPGP